MWNLGTWNVRSISGKEQELSDEFDRLNLDILMLTETKKKGTGEEYLVNGHILLYSGVKPENRAAAGVGCIINKRIIKQVKKWEAHTERILSVEMDIGKNELVTIVAAYGPNEDDKIETKNKFWESLNEITEVCKGKIFIAGDLNGRVGNDNTETKVIGKCGETKRNSNGLKILEYCVLNDMVVANTFFEHRDIHKYTRRGKNETEKSIIDYILTERRNRRDVIDVRVRRGAEIFSDHYLLVAKIRKYSDTTERDQNERQVTYETINTYKLRDRHIAQRYSDKITHKILKENINVENESVEKIWQMFKRVVLESAKETCGVLKVGNNKKQTAWWNHEIKEEVKDKKKKWRTYLGEKSGESYEAYKAQRTRVKDMIKKAKEDCWRKFGQKMERNSKENQKLFYKTLKNIREKKPAQKIATVKNKKGEIITGEKQIMERWKQHFEELLRSSASETTKNSLDEVRKRRQLTKQDTEGNTTRKITIEELKDAINWLKSGKAPGHDRITAEMLKNLGTDGVRLLLQVCNKAWSQKRIPDDWKIGVVLPVHKKGDSKDCDNYRGITLLSTAIKTYERILERRLSTVTESTLSESQSGFRKGRSIQDHIFTIRQVIHKTLQTKSKAYFAFVDLEKAFDRVRRQTVWDILEKRKVDKHLIEAVKSVYRKSINYVIYRNMKSDTFETPEGLRQGGVLSPILFCLFMDEIMKECTPKLKKLSIGYKNLIPVEVTECVFADDVVILAENEASLQKNLEIWEESLMKYDMKMNINKTKVMMTSTEQENMNIKIKGQLIEQVVQYRYLGVTIKCDGNQEADIEERIEATSRTFHAMKNSFIKKREISNGTKMTVYKTIIRPILTFGCESWVLNKKLESRIQSMEMKYLRGVMGVTRIDRVRNSDIREELKIPAITEFIEERQLSWWGHLQRAKEDRQVKRIWEARVKIKRGRGRPKESWEDAIVKALQRRGKQIPEARILARDRKQWARFVHR